MVKVLGPVMSLSASGDLGGSINFFYGKSGPVVRKKLKYKPPYSNVWEVNKVYFAAASERWKSFSAIQKNAWAIYLRPICDTTRDRFMGEQIQAWNASPLNDLSWPQVGLPVIIWPEPEIYYSPDTSYYSISTMFKEITYEEFLICGMNWYNSASKVVCQESDFLKSTVLPYTKFYSTEIPKHYIWVKAWRVNGSLSEFHYLGEK
jgi:hypothetical protein